MSGMRSLLVAAVLLLLCVVCVPSPVSAFEDIYCGISDCYAVLGVTSDAPQRSIKKAFYKLSLELHPDKNPDPAAIEQFRAITEAYEVVGNAESRAAYDEALQHPEQIWRNKMRYYQHRYKTKQIAAWKIVLFVLVLVSVLHYRFWIHRHHKLQALLRQSPLVQQRMRHKVKAELIEEKLRAGEKRPEPSSGEIETRMLREDVSRYAELASWEGRHPVWSDAIPVWLALAPFRLAKALYWHARYYVLFSLLGRPYDAEAADYATGAALQISHAKWCRIPEDERAELVEQQLWIPKNMNAFKRKMQAPKKKTW